MRVTLIANEIPMRSRDKQDLLPNQRVSLLEIGVGMICLEQMSLILRMGSITQPLRAVALARSLADRRRTGKRRGTCLAFLEPGDTAEGQL